MAAPARSGSGRILLVDDDALILAQISDTLKAEGFAVITATSAVKAVEIAKFDSFDLILSDINMPRMDGLEFRDVLRGDSRTAGVPFAFLTSADTVENRRLARELGARGFLLKPADPALLLALVRNAVSDSAGRAALAKQDAARRRDAVVVLQKLSTFGIGCRYSADSKRVQGEVSFPSGKLVSPFSGEPTWSATFASVGHDRIVFETPKHLSHLPPIAILDLADAPAFVGAVEKAYTTRGSDQARAKKFLEKFKLKTEYDHDGFRIVARVKIGRDEVTFSAVDSRTILLESLNGKPLASAPGETALQVDISQATSGVDVEIELESVIQKNRADFESRRRAPTEEELPVFQGKIPAAAAAPAPAATAPAAPSAPAPAAPPPPAWAAPRAPAGAAVPVPASGGTMFHCGTCDAMYVVGDDVDDERLLSQCPDCIAKS
jgi:two-component system chemotaxis response regulator CheY